MMRSWSCVMALAFLFCPIAIGEPMTKSTDMIKVKLNCNRFGIMSLVSVSLKIRSSEEILMFSGNFLVLVALIQASAHMFTDLKGITNTKIPNPHLDARL